MSSAGAVGIDFGGNTALIAVAKKGGVEVVVNDASNRETPIVVGFGENERFLGEQGYVQLKSNFKNTIVYANRFTGITADSSFYNEEKKWLYNNIIVNPDNKINFEVTYRGEKKRFSSEQVTAMALQKLKQIVKKNDVSHNEMVLSVPSYYTEQERRGLLDAAKIADIKVLKLMNESTAIALGYGIFRKADLTAAARNVLFIDFGHCKTSAFVASFTNTKLKILNQVHERNLGVRDIDWTLLDFYGKICVDKYDANPVKKEKTRLRMIDAIEKQRKILSSNMEAGINVDYIVEDNDLSYDLTREKFEELATPVVNKFKNLLETLKADIKCVLHSVEIVGGGTRIPIIQRAIQEVFGLDLSRTLNASEHVARGCAIQAAMLSPLFKVAQYEIEESNYYPIRCAWLFKNPNSMDIESDAKNNPEKQTSILFDKGCSIPNIKSVTFHREDAIDFRLIYDPVPPGANPVLTQFRVHPPKPKEKEFGVRIRVTLNKDGITEFDSAYLNEEYEEVVPSATTSNKMEEEKPAGDKPQEQQQAAAPNVVKKTRTTKLNVDVSNFYSLPQQQVNQLFDEECQMTNQDRVAHETYERKNDLETYIYDMRSKLDDKYHGYINPSQKSAFLQELDSAETWLYGEGAKTTKSIYASKLEQLKKHGDPITQRYREYESVPEKLDEFHKNLGVYESVASSTDPNFEHITHEERKPILENVAEHRDWIVSVRNQLNTADRLNNPPVSTQDVLARHKTFVDKHYATINKPKPKPQAPQAKPDETKPDQPKGDDANAGGNAGTGQGEKMDIEK